MPGIAQPIGAIFLILLRKPRNLVVAPDPVELATIGSGLSGLFADTVVVELDKIRQVVARPAAGSNPAPAPVVNAVGKPYFEDRLLRLIGDFHNPEWKGMEIQQEMSISDQPTVRNMSIA
jgi:hypothetical protein